MFIYSCKNARFLAIFVKHTCSKKHQHLQSLHNNGLCWIQVPVWNTCMECAKTSHMSTKYTYILLNWVLKHKIAWNTPHNRPIHVSTILWTCPQKCGHYPNTNFICKIAVMHTCQILTLATSYGMLFRIIAKKLQIEHISSCRIAHMSTTHQSTKMCRRYIYRTSVNVHRPNFRKAGVLKLLQDKNQLLKKHKH